MESNVKEELPMIVYEDSSDDGIGALSGYSVRQRF
jgi:hypothetical protein